MFTKWLSAMAAALCLALAASAPASANYIETATVNANCTNYTVSATGIDLIKGNKYKVQWWFGLTDSSGNTTTYNGAFKVRSLDKNGDFNASKTYTWNPPIGAGTYTFSWGHAFLYDVTAHQKRNEVYINFNPTQFSCNGTCYCNTTNQQGFNGTGISAGDYIWFNSNFKATGIPTGIPSDGTTLYFTNGTISFTSGGVPYTVSVPNGQVTFTNSVTCATTTFDSATNTWLTQLPVGGDDEIMMQDVAWLVPSGFAGKVDGNVTWNATVTTSTSGVSIQWKWGAAVYTQLTTDYNQLQVKPTHNDSCSYNNGDHAGTPEGENSSNEPWKDFVIGGGTGGGGSNFTGSWSGTVNASITCPRN